MWRNVTADCIEPSLRWMWGNSSIPLIAWKDHEILDGLFGGGP